MDGLLHYSKELLGCFISTKKWLFHMIFVSAVLLERTSGLITTPR